MTSPNEGKSALSVAMPIIVFMMAQTFAFAYWIIDRDRKNSVSNAVLTNRVDEIREWQIRQDKRITVLLDAQAEMQQNQAEVSTLLEQLRLNFMRR